MPAIARLRSALARALLRTIGRASTGVRTCLDLGLTAGKTVDYVYRNVPSGLGGLGRAVDRRFLSHPAWEAVRLRRANVERLLASSIEALRAEGRRASILDVASGPAAYVLSVVGAQGSAVASARCRDLDERWLREGEAEARRRGLDQVSFERGDAFDRAGLLAVQPRPNVAVSSGFYDWITDDAEVRRSLALLHDVLEPGGFLVVTSQSSHPDLGFVSAVFTDFRGAPLRMKMRPAGEVEGWIRAAGFEGVRTLRDPEDRYAVVQARKAT